MFESVVMILISRYIDQRYHVYRYYIENVTLERVGDPRKIRRRLNGERRSRNRSKSLQIELSQAIRS